MDREAWRAAVHGVTKSQIRLSDRTELRTQIQKAASQIALRSCSEEVKSKDA